jgi:hypothetical protein
MVSFTTLSVLTSADDHPSVFTASMFATNFVASDDHVKFNRGQDLLTEFSQSKTIGTGNTMTQHFCSKCGTLMFRTGSGFPGVRIMRVGTVDDFTLHNTTLKPRVEYFTKDRAAWLHPSDGAIQVEDFNLK